MAIPDYQTFMLPVLRFLASGDLHRRGTIVDVTADTLNVSAEDRTLLLPSGKATILRSRVGWALTYLKQGGLVETPSRGLYRVTTRGRQVLATNPQRVDNSLLEQFAEFRAFKERSRAEDDAPEIEAVTADAVTRTASPEEALETAYRTLRASLISQLLDVLKTVDPTRFESIVVDVLQAMGYGGDGRARLEPSVALATAGLMA